MIAHGQCLVPYSARSARPIYFQPEVVLSSSQADRGVGSSLGCEGVRVSAPLLGLRGEQYGSDAEVSNSVPPIVAILPLYKG